MEQIRLDSIEVSGNRETFFFSVSNQLKQYFRNKPYVIEYTIDNRPLDLSSVPKGVLAVPFICNVLPIIWMTDAELIVPEVDEDFYQSIEKFKSGYIDMYPNVMFRGKVKAEKIQKNEPAADGRSATFFSGGVDAYCTLARHIDERPDLLTLWGADIPFENQSGWNVLYQSLSQTAQQLNLSIIGIHSSFRDIIDEEKLTETFKPILHDGWWHGVQHGIGLIGHAAPCNYLRNVTMQYIAASFSPDVKGVTCASWPTIDNNVKYNGCKTIHDAFISRQEKISIIIAYHKTYAQPIHLHVCWRTNTGNNCCKCEKCCRTIMGLLTEGENPEEYGFTVNAYVLWRCKWLCMEKFTYDFVAIPFWGQVQMKEKENIKLLKDTKNYQYVRWMEKFDFEHPKKQLVRKAVALLQKIMAKISSKYR